MIIDCIGCLHGFFPVLQGGDVLIITGDLTPSDKLEQYLEFNLWLKKQDYDIKIVIGGNHDMLLEKGIDCKISDDYIALIKPILAEKTIYLENSGTEYKGLKFWGTPHSLWFDRINPHCTAFTGHEDELKEKYDLIPNDIDILVSHSPPFNILDHNDNDFPCGSTSLKDVIDRINPKLFICSHIHEQGGKIFKYNDITFINCSIMNADYHPTNLPIRIIL